MPGLRSQWKAETVAAVTHLALLGVKRQERHAGVTKEKEEVAAAAAASFRLKIITLFLKYDLVPFSIY